MTAPPEELLMRLLKFGTSRKIREFINSNPSMDLHYPTKNLSTPLTTAINRSDPAILTLLIDKVPANLDTTLTQPCGRTALMHAAYYAKNPEILNVLIKKGADCNKCDINGRNCLFYAVIGQRPRNVAALLDCRLPIESRDCDGRTPLMISVYLSNQDVFEYLISRGADLSARDDRGLNGLHLAILRRRRECVIALTKRLTVDLPTPYTKVSTQRLARELMADILPTKRTFYDDERDAAPSDLGFGQCSFFNSINSIDSQTSRT